MTVRTFHNVSRSEGQLLLLRSLLGALDPFFRIRATFPARSIQAFLLVSEKEGLSVSEYAKRADMPITTMSRNLIDMSDRDSNYDEGLGLVEGNENPTNRREKIYNLTAKGRALLAHITKGVK